jgi:integrase
MMSSIFPRGRKLYAKVQDVDGRWLQLATGHSVGQEEAARKWAADRVVDVQRRRAAMNGKTGPLTVTVYADGWLDKRTNVTAADDRTRITKHVLPRIGHMLMTDVKPRHIDDVIEQLKAEGKLAPRTIRSLSGLLHTMFKRAVKEELIAANPVQMERGTLPKKVDKDPTWRSEAIYTRAETEQLISDERILADRRVLYALKFLAGGLRHGEAARLTWRSYDAAATPLGRLALGKTKSGVPREVPVHPTLAKILAAWKLSGWEATYGRKPQTEDLIVPTRNMTARDANESQRQLVADLELLELRTKAGERRKRRGHDLRRTFITLARSDGAFDGLLRWITHGPSADMIDVYTTPPWHSLCAEMAKVRIDLLEGKVIELPIAAIAGDPAAILGAALVQPPQRRGTAKEKERPRRDSKANFRLVSDAQRQKNRHVDDDRSSPDSGELHQTAPRTITTACDLGLAVMRAAR